MGVEHPMLYRNNLEEKNMQKTYRPFVRADVDAFFGLFVDNLANILVLATTLTGVIKMPHDIVYGRVLPAFALAVLAASIYYFVQAKRVAKAQGRDDICALPFGAPTTALFGFLFSIILPVYLISGDPMTAWRVGVTACFINGVIEVLGSFFGETIRKITPRAALFGSLAGIAIAFIALKPTMQVFSRPQIGFLPFAIILLGLIAKVKMPKNLPAGLLAVVAGTAIAWIGGYMDPAAIVEGASNIGFYIVKPSFGDLIAGFKDVLPYLAIIIPLATHNFLSTMQNVESAAAVGDQFDTKETMLVDGFSTILGSFFGSVLPTTVYVGHPGYKAIGAHAGYTLMNGIAVAAISFFGLVAVIRALIPLEAVYVILIYVGIIMLAQAFSTSEKRHYPAVAIALIPHIANYALGQINNTIQALGASNTDPAVIAALAGKSVDHAGLTTLAGGSTMNAMLLGAMVCFIIDHDYKKAAVTACISAALSFFGFIHASKLAFGAATPAAIGYLIIAGLMLVYYFLNVKKADAELKIAE